MSHSRYSASSAERWLNCPGSVRLSEGIEQIESPYALEGTKAHEQAARCLTEFCIPDDPAVREYVDVVLFYVDLVDGDATTEVELRIEHPAVEDFGGTVDCLIIAPRDFSVVVVDFKYGQGVAVDATNNAQLLSYMLLARDSRKLRGYQFTGVIVQPRTGGKTVKSWTVADGELDQFAEAVKTAQKQDLLRAGDWCRWCLAKHVCPVLRKKAVQLAKADAGLILESNDHERWNELLHLEKPLKQFFDELRKRMLAAIERGESFADWKAVKALGNRSWKISDRELWEYCAKNAVPTQIIAPPKFLTPTQAAKALSDLDWAKVAEHVHRPDRGIKLVPQTDSREAVEFLDPVSVFAEVDDAK